jgi:hypothetical protein
MVVRISGKETATNGLIPRFPRFMKALEAIARQARTHPSTQTVAAAGVIRSADRKYRYSESPGDRNANDQLADCGHRPTLRMTYREGYYG